MSLDKMVVDLKHIRNIWGASFEKMCQGYAGMTVKCKDEGWLVLTKSPALSANRSLMQTNNMDLLQTFVSIIEKTGNSTSMILTGDARKLETPSGWRRPEGNQFSVLAFDFENSPLLLPAGDTNTQFEYRLLTPDDNDIQSVIEMVSKCSDLPNGDYSETMFGLAAKHYGNDPDVLIWIAKNTETFEIVSVLYAIVDGEDCIMSNLLTNTSERKQGHAKALASVSISDLREKGVKYGFFFATFENAKMYQRFGAVEIEQWEAMAYDAK